MWFLKEALKKQPNKDVKPLKNSFKQADQIIFKIKTKNLESLVMLFIDEIYLNMSVDAADPEEGVGQKTWSEFFHHIKYKNNNKNDFRLMWPRRRKPGTDNFIVLML